MLTIIAMTEENINQIVGWAGSLIGDLMPLLVVIIGISIGAFIIKVILNMRG